MTEQQPLDGKTILTYFMQHDLPTFMTAELKMLSGKSQYNFTIYRDFKQVWEGNLQHLTEMVLLGVTYKSRLEQQGKEKPCETQPTSTPKTYDGEQG